MIQMPRLDRHSCTPRASSSKILSSCRAVKYESECLNVSSNMSFVLVVAEKTSPACKGVISNVIHVYTLKMTWLEKTGRYGLCDGENAVCCDRKSRSTATSTYIDANAFVDLFNNSFPLGFPRAHNSSEYLDHHQDTAIHRFPGIGSGTTCVFFGSLGPLEPIQVGQDGNGVKDAVRVLDFVDCNGNTSLSNKPGVCHRSFIIIARWNGDLACDPITKESRSVRSLTGTKLDPGSDVSGNVKRERKIERSPSFHWAFGVRR